MAESLWSNERIRDRYHALVPCEANMGEMEYWNVLRDVGERVSYELRNDYEAERQRLFADHAALVARVKELEAQLANTQQWAGDAVACIRHGMELMPLDQFRHWTGVAAIEQVYSQMMEDANHE